MRRMLTNKGVVDVVNKAIEEGEIQAGGLTPEQEAVLDQTEYNSEEDSFSIKTNNLFIIDNKYENALLGFTLEEDEEENVKANVVSDYKINFSSADDVTIEDQPILTGKKLVLDFENSTSKTVTQEQATNITNFVYSEIVLQRFGNAARSMRFIPSDQGTNISIKGNGTYANLYSSKVYMIDSAVLPGEDVIISSTGFKSRVGYQKPSGSSLELTGTTLTVSGNTYSTAIAANPAFRQKLTSASGTLTSSKRPAIETGTDNSNGAAGDICFSYQISSSPEKFVYLRCVSYDYTNKKMILQGNWVDWDTGTATLYTMKLNMADGSYTIS